MGSLSLLHRVVMTRSRTQVDGALVVGYIPAPSGLGPRCSRTSDRKQLKSKHARNEVSGKGVVKPCTESESGSQ